MLNTYGPSNLNASPSGIKFENRIPVLITPVLVSHVKSRLLCSQVLCAQVEKKPSRFPLVIGKNI